MTLQINQILLEMLATRYGKFPPERQENIFSITAPNTLSQLMITLLSTNISDEFGELLLKLS